MKKALYVLTALVILVPSLNANEISYSLSNLGNGDWAYSYTVVNTTTAGGIFWFDIYFPSVTSPDALQYSNIAETANPDPGNWTTTVFPPSAINLGGIYDAFTLNAPIPLNQSLGGFTVRFHYAGTAPLGAQEFEIFDPNFNLLESGMTTEAVPEPSAVLLFISGSLGLTRLRKRSDKG